MNDTSPDAYEKLVDRLLASPRYAEQQTMHWLDAVRYADTCGFHGDNAFPAWPYRDYVLHAFRDNKPFDEFTREQLAGDLMPNATVEQRVASAYNRLNRTSAEGGLQPKEYLAKYGADRVRTAGAVWMGSTLGCAECHDHKFDPVHSARFLLDEGVLRRHQGDRPGAGPRSKTPGARSSRCPPPSSSSGMDELKRRAGGRASRGSTAKMETLAPQRAAWEKQTARALRGRASWPGTSSGPSRRSRPTARCSRSTTTSRWTTPATTAAPDRRPRSPATA